MLTFPLHNAALDLQGKPPEELPHGLLPVPPEVRELVAGEYARFPAETRAPYEWRQVCFQTVAWYFDDLGYPVIYRETPEGPEVLAVGYEERETYVAKNPRSGWSDDMKTYMGHL